MPAWPGPPVGSRTAWSGLQRVPAPAWSGLLGGLPYHQLRGEHHLCLVLQIQHHAREPAAHLDGRLPDRGQRRLGVGRGRDVVEADDGDVVGHPPAGLAQRRAARPAPSGRWPRTPRRGSGSSASSWRIAVAPDSRVKSPTAMIERRSESRRAVAVAGEPVDPGDHVLRSGDGRDPARGPAPPGGGPRARRRPRCPLSTYGQRRRDASGRPLQTTGTPMPGQDRRQRIGPVHRRDRSRRPRARWWRSARPGRSSPSEPVSISTSCLSAASISWLTPRMMPAKNGSSEKTRVAGSGKHQGDRVGPLGDQAPRRLVGDVAQLLHGAVDRLADLRGDAGGAVDHARGGRPGHSCPRRPPSPGSAAAPHSPFRRDDLAVPQGAVLGGAALGVVVDVTTPNRLP